MMNSRSKEGLSREAPRSAEAPLEVEKLQEMTERAFGEWQLELALLYSMIEKIERQEGSKPATIAVVAGKKAVSPRYTWAETRLDTLTDVLRDIFEVKEPEYGEEGYEGSIFARKYEYERKLRERELDLAEEVRRLIPEVYRVGE